MGNKREFILILNSDKFSTYSSEEQEKIREFIFQTNAPSYVKEVVLNPNTIRHEKRLEIIQTVANSKTWFQAKCSSNVAQNVNCLANENIVELVQMASSAVSLKAAHYGSVLLQIGTPKRIENLYLLVEKVFNGEYIDQIEKYLMQLNREKVIDIPIKKSEIDRWLEILENCTTEEEENKVLQRVYQQTTS